uniref:Nitrate reductase 1, delta subunit n=1 Tax=uncultured prokaryote TaxID=198431 RepID=H5SEM5_9ZZZZ|nr:nitrate reductase 1, delta subunit [uncultured prokaryote]
MDKRGIYNLFAMLFEYPDDHILRRAIELSSHLKACSKGAWQSMETFAEKLKSYSRERLEEIYTSTFDLQPLCYPYAGYHLFGDDYRRSQFMAKLKEHYRQKGFSFEKNELPDHIGVILTYMGSVDEDETVLKECLLPVVEKMISLLNNSPNNPYFDLLRSLSLFLKEGKGSGDEKITETDGGNNHG